MLLLRLADHLIAEHDPDFAIAGGAFDRLQPRLLRRVGVDPRYVALEAAHEEEQAEDGEGPHREHEEKDRLVAGHSRQFVRA